MPNFDATIVERRQETEDTVKVVFKKGGDEAKGRGETLVPRETIRWYSRDHDAPTAAYWEKHENAKIESKWIPLREQPRRCGRIVATRAT